VSGGGAGGASTGSVSSWTATVTDVQPSTQGDATTVVSLQLPDADARQVAAAAPTGLSLVEVSGDGG
jgi:hypothetical protein